MEQQQTHKCAHAACRCSVPEGKRFCSQFCEEHEAHPVGGDKVVCGCGHPDCGGSEAAA